MKMWLAMCLAAALLFSAGCFAPPDPARESVGELQGQLQSAKVIVNPVDRNQALENIAMSAIDSDYPVVAFDATVAISDNSQRDEAAAYCARKMDSIGNRDAAEDFVRLIKNSVLRDQLHVEFAS